MNLYQPLDFRDFPTIFFDKTHGHATAFRFFIRNSASVERWSAVEVLPPRWMTSTGETVNISDGLAMVYPYQISFHGKVLPFFVAFSNHEHHRLEMSVATIFHPSPRHLGHVRHVVMWRPSAQRWCRRPPRGTAARRWSKRLRSRWGPDSPPSEQRDGGLENIHEWFILVHNG